MLGCFTSPAFFNKLITKTEQMDKLVENFLVIEIQENSIIMLCCKCEGSFNIDPCSEDDKNLVWCDKKDVLVPQCPHCHITDAEE